MTTEKRHRGRPRNFETSAQGNNIQAVDRAIDVLDVLAAGGAMTLSQIAAEMDQSPATIYRVLSTFRARNIVSDNEASQTWSIGPEAFRLGAAFLRRSNVTERARPLMHKLMELTGETSNLGIETGLQVMFVSQVETHESIRAFFPPGTRAPMHASGIGKALLSRFSETRLAKLLAQTQLERFTPRTIVSATALHSDLALIRTRGYAFDDEEKALGMRCIAAPILDVHGEAVAGISISGPSQRLPDARIADIGAMVNKAATEVSRGLGAAT